MSCSGQDFREVVFVEAAERRLVLTPTQYVTFHSKTPVFLTQPGQFHPLALA